MLKHGSSSLCHWNWFLFIFVSICLSNAAELDEYGRTALAKNITAILDRLVNKSTYDRRLRPNYGGEPVEVGITIFVSSISAVSEVEMDYTLDIYLRQMWSDRRLAFNASIENITIDVEYMKSIWVPDTFFPNEKKSLAHTATTHNSFLRITKAGNVTTSQRLTVTAACSMDLLLFPLDSQECTLEIESYGYSTEDITLVWSKGAQNSTDVDQEVKHLPTFELVAHWGSETTARLSTGNYSRLLCTFRFARNIGFYWIQIYQPSMMVVIISWVAFWINRDSAPARVTLGIMTVLTMTTLMTTTNRQMPKVSYIKAVDIYLGVCYVMVFAALLEYAAVSYSNKKIQDRTRKRQNVQAEPKPAGQDTALQVPPTTRPAMATTAFGRTITSIQEGPLQNTSAQWTTLPMQPDLIGHTSSHAPMGSFDLSSRFQPIPTNSTKSRFSLDTIRNIFWRRTTRPLSGASANTADRKLQLVASGIDKYSRAIFPLIFGVFNIIYWTVFLKQSGKI